MSEAKQRPGAKWWTLQIAVGVCLLLPPWSRLRGGSVESDSRVDWVFLILGLGITINSLIWFGVSIAAGRRGWLHPRSRA